MTPEEARQLKPGDRVLVEATVTTANSRKPYEHMTFHGNVAVMIAVCGTNAASCSCVSPEAIREKIAPPRRKFREGDIVKPIRSPYYYKVDRGEFADGRVFAGGWSTPYKAEDIILICPVEERHDRKEVGHG